MRWTKRFRKSLKTLRKQNISSGTCEIEKIVDKPIPTVSVIIPAYNRAHVIGQAIQSALQQTCQNFEIIVVDDASTDNTKEVVSGFADPRIRYLRHEQNCGAPQARNSGAESAQGNYLAFLDSDDIWYPEFLERQLGVLSALPPTVGMSCCNMMQKAADGYRVVGPGKRSLTFDDNLIHANGICASSFVIRKGAFQSIEGFDVKFSSFQDFDFLLRMALKYQIFAIDDALFEYRLGDDSISRNMVSKANGFERIISIYKNDILRLGLMHRYLFRLGQYYILSGNLETGRRYWLRALRYKVWDAKIWKHLLLTLGGVGLYKRALQSHNKRIDLQYVTTKIDA